MELTKVEPGPEGSFVRVDTYLHGLQLMAVKSAEEAGPLTELEQEYLEGWVRALGTARNEIGGWQ